MLSTAPSGSKAEKASLLSSSSTFATTASAIILKNYGIAAYDWDPLTISLELRDDFETDVNESVMDKWCAMQVVMTSDAFFKRIDAFLNVCNTLSSGEPMFSAFDPVTTEEAAWAIMEVAMNRDMLPFSNTIKRYLRSILAKDGFSKDSYPRIFEVVFDDEKGQKFVLDSISKLGNTQNIDRYLIENLKDMKSQFSSAPDIDDLDEKIIKSGIGKALGFDR